MERVRRHERNRRAGALTFMTYLITFSCYGTHLHGDERGSIDRRHKGALARARGPEPALEAFERTEMPQPAYFLDERRRAIVLQAIRDACLRRNWDLCAVHIRTEHLHAVCRLMLPRRVSHNNSRRTAARR